MIFFLGNLSPFCSQNSVSDFKRCTKRNKPNLPRKYNANNSQPN